MIRAPALTAAGLVLAAYVIRRRYLTRPRIVRDGAVSSTTRRASVSSTTLDPRSPEDWASLRANAHALLHECLDRMECANEGRTWTPVPAAIKDSLHEPLPREERPPLYQGVSPQVLGLTARFHQIHRLRDPYHRSRPPHYHALAYGRQHRGNRG